jgi:hypothetical protein
VHHRLSPSALLDPTRFDVLAVLKDDERLAFLHQFFWKKPSRITRVHHLCTAFLLATVAVAGHARGFDLGTWLVAASLMLAVAVVVVMPLHEAVHAAAYWALGARDLRWTFSFRREMASVAAHRFVLSRNELLFVAALPSAAIGLALGTAAVATETLRPYLALALLFHHVGSRGDWAYLSYFLSTPRELYVFEDAESGEIRLVKERYS